MRATVVDPELRDEALSKTIAQKLAKKYAPPARGELWLVVFTTAHYLTEQLAPTGVVVSRLAQGVPIGGELDYLDEGTLAAAIKARKRI